LEIKESYRRRENSSSGGRNGGFTFEMARQRCRK
jgi:hypothetical protein